MSEALEIQIETAWFELSKMNGKRRRTLYLSPRRHVVWRERDLSPRCIEIGTYSNKATLTDLRDDVFWVHDHGREAA